MKFGELIKDADWKTEKHVPVIEAPGQASAGQPIDIKVSVGKEIPHPNTTEHHIRWIQLYFKPQSEQPVYELFKVDFNVHGEAVKGPNLGPAHTNPVATMNVSLAESGELIAVSYCNIHGVWESSMPITIV